MAGAEEIYRSGRFDPYTQAALAQMQGQTAQMREDMSRLGDVRAAGMRERGRMMADLPMKGYQAYRMGKEKTQEDVAYDEGRQRLAKQEGRAEESHKSGLAAQKQQMEASRAQIEASRAQMGRAEAEEARRAGLHEWQYGPREGGLSRADEDRNRSLSQDDLTRMSLQSQIDMNKAVMGRQEEDRKHAQAVMLLEEAAENPEALEATKANLRAQGYTNNQIKMANYEAGKNVAAGQTTKSFYWENSTQEGQNAIGMVSNVEMRSAAAEKLINDIQTFDQAGFSSEAAEQALGDVRQALQVLGQDVSAAGLDNFINWKGQTRTSRMKDAARRAIGDLNSDLMNLKARYGNAPSQRIRNQIIQLEQRIQRLGRGLGANGQMNAVPLVPNAGPGMSVSGQNAQFLGIGNQQPQMQPVGGFQPAPQGAAEFIGGGGGQQPPPAPPPQGQPAFFQGEVNPRQGSHTGNMPPAGPGGWRRMPGR